MLRRLRKSGVLAAFFCLFINLPALAGSVDLPLALTQKALALELDKHPVWLALLHSEHGEANIQDPGFLLSAPDFSPAHELEKTLSLLYANDPQNVCRFPARYHWLQSQLKAPNLPLNNCPEVNEFRAKAPLSELSLVFANESLSQPASMMGHLFLKLSGNDAEGIHREHAIAFFTDANTYNIPKLFIESTLTGKQGFFALSPYTQEVEHYSHREQRNLWEYPLRLEPHDLALIQLHLLELKHSRLSYFFQSYNCATLLRFVLALSGNIPASHALWVTPKDVLKDAESAGLIENTRTLTASRWMVRALSESLSSEISRSLSQRVLSGTLDTHDLSEPDTNRSFLEWQFSQAYNQYAAETGLISPERRTENLTVLKSIAPQFTEKRLTSNPHIDPLNTPADSQFLLSHQSRGKGQGTRLTFLPTSHELTDDNRAYPHEAALQVMGITFKSLETPGRLELERLTLYSMQSLIPWNPLAGGLSGRIISALEPISNRHLEAKRGFNLQGSGGLTYRVFPDVDVFALGGGGVQFLESRWHPITRLEGGLIIREIWDMKTSVSWTGLHDPSESARSHQRGEIQHAWFLNKALSAQLGWARVFNQTSSDTQVSAGLKWLF